MLSKQEIENRFGVHKATIEGENATLPLHRDIRIKFRAFAEFLEEVLPDGRAKSVAFTELENASMWSHKAVAELEPLVEEPSEWQKLYREERQDRVRKGNTKEFPNA